MSLPAVDSPEDITGCLEKVKWTMDGPLHLFDSVSYPETVWYKKKDDCDGFAILAAALLQKCNPVSMPVLITLMLRPMKRSHTVCAFKVSDETYWYYDNYFLREGEFSGYGDIVREVQKDCEIICWDVADPVTLETIEFHRSN